MLDRIRQWEGTREAWWDRLGEEHPILQHPLFYGNYAELDQYVLDNIWGLAAFAEDLPANEDFREDLTRVTADQSVPTSLRQDAQLMLDIAAQWPRLLTPT